MDLPGRRRRRPWPVELSEDAHDGLDALATTLHTSKTALIEAVGRLGKTDRTVVSETVVTLARELDRQRRTRR